MQQFIDFISILTLIFVSNYLLCALILNYNLSGAAFVFLRYLFFAVENRWQHRVKDIINFLVFLMFMLLLNCTGYIIMCTVKHV